MSRYSLDFKDVEEEYKYEDFQTRVMKPEHILAWMVDFGTKWYEVDELTMNYETNERVWADAFYWDYQARLGLLEVRKEKICEGDWVEIFSDDPDFHDRDKSEITHVRLSPTAMKRFINKGSKQKNQEEK